MPGTLFISLTRAGIGKGSAVALIAAEYGLPLSRVMMVGDGHNDVTAMRVVGHPVAMGNADAEARAAARYHVAHVDEGAGPGGGAGADAVAARPSSGGGPA